MSENKSITNSDEEVMQKSFDSMRGFKPSPEREAIMLKRKQEVAQWQKERELHRLKQHLDYMRIPERYRGLTLESYTVGSEKQKKVVEYLREYRKRNLPDMENLIIHGLPGTGKTHMICAFLQDFREGGAQYWKLSDIMRTVKDGYFPGSGDTELRFINRLAEIPILVIDEIGRQGGNIL